MIGRELDWGNNIKRALFEVSLVVVGILIAFQIDTWNNDRQLRNKEIQYLSFIREGLQSDLQSIKQVTDFNAEKTEAINVLFQVLSVEISNEEAADALLAQVNTLGTFDLFIPNRIAFDNMVSAESIELVSDRELRILLSDYYSDLTPFNGTQERVAQISRRLVDILIDDLSHSGISTGPLVFNNPWIRTKSEVTVHKSETFIGTLFGMQTVIRAQSDELKEKIEKIDRLMALIEEQLGQDS